MRAIEFAAGGAEGVFRGRALVAEHTGQESRDGLGDGQRGELTTGQDVVADREFLEGEFFQEARVETFVAAAEEQDALFEGELFGSTLVERPPGRAQRDPPERSVSRLEPGDGFGDRLGTQEHPGAATEWPIVHAAMAIAGEVAEVDAFDPDLALLPRHAQDAFRGVRLDGFGEQGQDGKERHDRGLRGAHRSCEKARKRRKGPG